MDRRASLLDGLGLSPPRIIEIGASISPIAPKREGWPTVVVDHAPATELRENYARQNAAAIEEMDVARQGGPLHEHFPKTAMAPSTPSSPPTSPSISWTRWGCCFRRTGC